MGTYLYLALCAGIGVYYGKQGFTGVFMTIPMTIILYAAMKFCGYVE